MKQLFFLGFYLFITLTFSQTYQITYEEYYTFIDGDFKTIQNDIRNNLERGIKSDKDIITLTLSQGISYYEYGNSFNLEKEDESKGDASNIHSKSISVCNIYKNQNSKILISQYINYMPDMYGEDILVEEELESYDWNLMDQTDMISGYKCRLAKAVRSDGTKLLAWYTDEIPINNGPRALWGLPGLILQAQINEKVLLLATSIKKLEKEVKIYKPRKGNKMSGLEFKNFKKELFRPRTMTSPSGQIIRIESPN